MLMDRTQLEQVIDAGRSSALNCLDIGNAIPASDPVGKMFRNEAMNRTIFFKVMDVSDNQTAKPFNFSPAARLADTRLDGSSRFYDSFPQCHSDRESDFSTNLPTLLARHRRS